MSEGQKDRKFKGIFEAILGNTPRQAGLLVTLLFVSSDSEDVQSTCEPIGSGSIEDFNAIKSRTHALYNEKTPDITCFRNCKQ